MNNKLLSLTSSLSKRANTLTLGSSDREASPPRRPYSGGGEGRKGGDEREKGESKNITEKYNYVMFE